MLIVTTLGVLRHLVMVTMDVVLVLFYLMMELSTPTRWEMNLVQVVVGGDMEV